MRRLFLAVFSFSAVFAGRKEWRDESPDRNDERPQSDSYERPCYTDFAHLGLLLRDTLFPIIKIDPNTESESISKIENLSICDAPNTMPDYEYQSIIARASKGDSWLQEIYQCSGSGLDHNWQFWKRALEGPLLNRIFLKRAVYEYQLAKISDYEALLKHSPDQNDFKQKFEKEIAKNKEFEQMLKDIIARQTKSGYNLSFFLIFIKRQWSNQLKACFFKIDHESYKPASLQALTSTLSITRLRITENINQIECKDQVGILGNLLQCAPLEIRFMYHSFGFLDATANLVSLAVYGFIWSVAKNNAEFEKCTLQVLKPFLFYSSVLESIQKLSDATFGPEKRYRVLKRLNVKTNPTEIDAANLPQYIDARFQEDEPNLKKGALHLQPILPVYTGKIHNLDPVYLSTSGKTGYTRREFAPANEGFLYFTLDSKNRLNFAEKNGPKATWQQVFIIIQTGSEIFRLEHPSNGVTVAAQSLVLLALENAGHDLMNKLKISNSHATVLDMPEKRAFYHEMLRNEMWLKFAAIVEKDNPELGNDKRTSKDSCGKLEKA